MFTKVPSVSTLLKDFTTLKAKLIGVIEYHSTEAEHKRLAIEAHQTEVELANKALKAVEKFV